MIEFLYESIYSNFWKNGLLKLKSTTYAPDKWLLSGILTIFSLGCSNTSVNNTAYFRYNESSGIASLDPAFAKNQSVNWAVHQLFNTLVATDAALNSVPELAYRWEVSEDGRTYRFFLRNDVFFHDHPLFPNGVGRKLTAEDVVFSFSRLINPATASSGAWVFNNKVDSLQPFLAMNDTVFQLKLLQPFKPILGILSMQYCSIVPREIVTYYGKEFRNNPVGTGPFQFGFWEEGQALVLRRYDRYFEYDSLGNRLPYLKGIQISFLQNKATEFLAFRQGKLDFMNDIDASFKDEVLSKEGALRPQWKNRLNIQKSPYLNIEYLGILLDSNASQWKTNPLRLKKVRQAINYGINKTKMMLYLRNSIGTPATAGFVPAGLPSFDSALVKGYHFHPAKTQSLLREAGFEGGKGLPDIRLLTIPAYADLAAFIAKELEMQGIPVIVEAIPKSLLLERTANSNAPFFRASWIGDYPDAENFLAVFYGKNPAPPNYTRFNNPVYDKLFEQAMKEHDDSIRYELYQAMDRIIIEEAPIVPLWYDQILRLVQPRVQGLYPNPLNLMELKTVRVIPQE